MGPGRGSTTPSRRPAAHLLVWRHVAAPRVLGRRVTAQGFVVVPSAGLFAEAPRLPVGVHPPQPITALRCSQLTREREARWMDE